MVGGLLKEMLKMDKRYTITISEELEKDLQIIMNAKDIRKSTAFRNSIIVYKLILDEIAKGNKLTIADDNNNVIKEIVLP